MGVMVAGMRPESAVGMGTSVVRAMKRATRGSRIRPTCCTLHPARHSPRGQGRGAVKPGSAPTGPAGDAGAVDVGAEGLVAAAAGAGVAVLAAAELRGE